MYLASNPSYRNNVDIAMKYPTGLLRNYRDFYLEAHIQLDSMTD